MSLWDLLTQYMTDSLRVLCTILAFAIPFMVYKVNRRLHKYGDPPWKSSNKEDS